MNPRRFNTLSLIFLLACESTPTPTQSQVSHSEVETPHRSTSEKTPTVQPLFEQGKNFDQGQQHPPLPAENPAWEWDAQTFVPDFGWFGEHNWADVKMRVVGHLAMGYRDIARVYLLRGQWDEAQHTYREMAQHLDKIDTTPSSFAEEIRQLLITSALRDAQILDALQGRATFPTLPKESLLYWRIEYWKLLEAPQNSDKISELQAQILLHFQENKLPAIDQFANFTDRHKLRQTLFQAYVDTVDPLLPTDVRWGYWRPEEVQRQASALILALEHLKVDGSSDTNLEEQMNVVATSKSLALPAPHEWWNSTPSKANFLQMVVVKDDTLSILLPSFYAYWFNDQSLDWTPEQFGRLPTGDSIIDVGGQPGPMGIGTLMKLDVSDPDHNAWLSSITTALEKSISSNPQETKSICLDAIDTLNTYTHGSRFYNVKQMRNACTRQLARSGHYSTALEIFKGSFPLHHQDWACPNREGLLWVIQGRLEVFSGDIETGLTTLQRSIESANAFLDNVTQAEKGLLTEPRPPMMGPKNANPKNGIPLRRTPVLKEPAMNGAPNPKSPSEHMHVPKRNGPP